VFVTCDGGGLYWSQLGAPGRPPQIGDCGNGDTLSLEPSPSSKFFAVFKNGEFAADTTVPVTAMFPHLQQLPGGYELTHLEPPLPPPKPTQDDVVVSGVTVERFGAMPSFGPYLSHGSAAPGAGWDGEASSSTPNARLDAKSDQAHGAGCGWEDDEPNSRDSIPGCSSCKDEGAVEPFLNCSYTSGVGAHVNAANSETFDSFRVLLLAHDSTDVERQALGRHRTTMLLAPHVLENPVFFHATDISIDGFKTAINQMADVGFEMMIFSFGSGFNLETDNPLYLGKIKGQIDYAKSKGIEVGGYDLICLDRGGSVPKEWVALGNEGDVCFASGWADHLEQLILNFITETGLSMLETDGPYGGETCASTNHSHHHDVSDSVYRQTQMQSAFYSRMRNLDVFINQPDNYFFQGGQKTGMGYDEQQYSLPRWRDLSVSRMGMYDDMYARLPTQGWMFVPLSDYHAGGPAASFASDPEALEFALAQYLGAGVAACYRGPVPYTSDAAQAAMKQWIGFYKDHRQTLIQPIVHIRRPDMQGWDGWIHVNPMAWGASQRRSCHRGKGVCHDNVDNEVAVAMLFNPTDVTLPSVNISLPVYYAGLDTSATVSVDNGSPATVQVTRDYRVLITLTMPPRSVHTVVLGAP